MFQLDLAEQPDIFIFQRKNNFHSSTQLGNEVVHCITSRYHKCDEEMKDSWQKKNHHTSLTWLGGKMKTKTSLQLILAGQKNILINYLQQSATIAFNSTCKVKKKNTLNSHPLYQQNPTQPITNRNTKTDFREKDFSNEGALHRCTKLTEYL